MTEDEAKVVKAELAQLIAGLKRPVDSSPQCQPSVPYVGDGWSGFRKGVVEGLEGTGQFERGSVTVEKVTGDVNAAPEKA